MWAIVLGIVFVGGTALLILPGGEQRAAKSVAQASPVTTTGATSAETPSAPVAPPGGTESAPPSKTAATAKPAMPAPDSKSGFEMLKGRWQRPDGGYVIDIARVNNDGRLDASYFNPQRINVAKAQASQEGAATKVFVECRDTNYPGSTYNLVYEPESDQLHGIYYQAALRQQFEVVFVRMK